jgi:hypothetical protein
MAQMYSILACIPSKGKTKSVQKGLQKYPEDSECGVQDTSHAVQLWIMIAYY